MLWPSRRLQGDRLSGLAAMFYGRREKRQAEQAEHGWRGVRISTGEASHEIMTGGETPSIVQDQIGQHFGPYSEFSVVVDQSHCSEFVHEVPEKSLAFIGSPRRDTHARAEMFRRSSATSGPRLR